MADNEKSMTIRATEQISDKFDKIHTGLGFKTQKETLSYLCDLAEMSDKIQAHADYTADIEAFRSTCQTLTNSYMHIIEVAEKQREVAENAVKGKIASMQEVVERLTADNTDLRTVNDDLNRENREKTEKIKALKAENESLTERLATLEQTTRLSGLIDGFEEWFKSQQTQEKPAEKPAKKPTEPVKPTQTQDKSTGAEKKPVQAQEKSADKPEKPVKQLPPVPAESEKPAEPVKQTQEKPADTDKKPADTDKKPADTDKKPTEAEEKPLTVNIKGFEESLRQY